MVIVISSMIETSPCWIWPDSGRRWCRICCRTVTACHQFSMDDKKNNKPEGRKCMNPQKPAIHVNWKSPFLWARLRWQPPFQGNHGGRMTLYCKQNVWIQWHSVIWPNKLLGDGLIRRLRIKGFIVEGQCIGGGLERERTWWSVDTSWNSSELPSSHGVAKSLTFW